MHGRRFQTGESVISEYDKEDHDGSNAVTSLNRSSTYFSMRATPRRWHEAEDNLEVQAYTQLGLVAAYSLVALVALVGSPFHVNHVK